MSFNIKGRDGNYYDIFHDYYYFVDDSNSFTADSPWKKNDNVITINNKLTTTRGTAKYKATTNFAFRRGPYSSQFTSGIYLDILNNNGSYLIAKYEIYTESKLYKMVGTFPNIKLEDDSVKVNKMFNRILIVAIGGGGGGERGISDRSGHWGGTGQTVAKYIDISSYPDIKIQIVIGSGGLGGIETSGANGENGNQTTVTIKSGSVVVESVVASGGGGAADYTPIPTNDPHNTGFQDLDYIVDGNTDNRGAGGESGGRYNGGPFHESGRNGKNGKNGVVYIYYFHK